MNPWTTATNTASANRRTIPTGIINAEIVAQLDVEENGAPRLLVFVCDWCLRAADDVSLLESYPANVRVVHIPCSGRIDPQMALLALRSGIDGVLVCGCKPGECHYQRGNYVSACKIELLNQMFEQIDANDGRVRFVQIGTQERGFIRDAVDGMLRHLSAVRESELVQETRRDWLDFDDNGGGGGVECPQSP